MPINPLESKIGTKRQMCWQKRSFAKLLHDNARSHIASKPEDTVRILAGKSFHFTRHYSIQYNLLQSMRHLFQSVDEIQKLLDKVIQSKDTIYFLDGIPQLLSEATTNTSFKNVVILSFKINLEFT